MHADKTARIVADPGLAVVRVEGADADAFLDSQSTAALGALEEHMFSPAALADPQGRVLVVFHAWRANDAWLLVLAASEVEWLCAHLARFVFRSRACIAAAPELRMFGVSGTNAADVLTATGLPAPETGTRLRAGPLEVAGLAGARWLVIGEETALADAARALASHAEKGNLDTWKRARLVANEVEIRTQTRGRFLPQMLGLVALGAVSFRKGCYPGQEIIARTQNLGRVKRKLSLLQLGTAAEAGVTIEHENTRLEVLDSVALSDGMVLVQAVAPI